MVGADPSKLRPNCILSLNLSLSRLSEREFRKKAQSAQCQAALIDLLAKP